jgi:hypothetical protein
VEQEPNQELADWFAEWIWFMRVNTEHEAVKAAKADRSVDAILPVGPDHAPSSERAAGLRQP